MNLALAVATGFTPLVFLLAVIALLLLPYLKWIVINRKMLAVRLFQKTGLTFFLRLTTVSGGAQSTLATVGSSLVAVIAGAVTWQVSITQTPGTAGAFQVYDVNQNLLATIPSSGPGSYQWTAPATGDPFSQGQTVGFVSVPSGTQNFIVKDSNLVPYVVPPNGGVYPAAGAIGQKSGRVFLTGATAQAYTLAAPVAGADDFKEITIVNVTAQAHTVTVPTNAYNGNTHIATFAAAVGCSMVLIALGGVWYTRITPQPGAGYVASVTLT